MGAMTTPLILTGLELARPDTHVLDTALLYAKELGAEVRAVHGMDLSRPGADVEAPSPAVRAMIEKLEERVASARERVEELERERATFGVPLRATLEDGRPADILLRLASEAREAGREVLFVVGSGRMQGPIAQRLLGSTADQLLRHAEAPVLVVPHAGDEEHSGGVTRSPRGGTWVVAFDGTDPAGRALHLASRWSKTMQSRLALVHASSDRGAEKQMRAFLGELGDPELAGLAGALTVLEETPAEAILAHAAAERASLVVIGSHGRKGIARAFFGSVAASVVRGTKVPVLCVR